MQQQFHPKKKTTLIFPFSGDSAVLRCFVAL